jgi:hypothetical protein
MRSTSWPDCTTAYDTWSNTYDSIDNPLIAQATCALEVRDDWIHVLEANCVRRVRGSRWLGLRRRELRRVAVPAVHRAAA